jgi:pimeloyl-ACP methyl ester carboxylesterase
MVDVRQPFSQTRLPSPVASFQMTIIYRSVLAICLVIAGLGSDTPPRWALLPGPPPMPAPEETGFAQVNGISMYYAIYGHGPPLLLIHGGLGSSDVWAAVLPLLTNTHEVIVADSRGQGRSTRTDERLTYTLMANDYLALLDHLRLKTVAVVGWSDGAIIGIDLAIHHPDRLTALFAQAANASPDGLVAVSRWDRRVPWLRAHDILEVLKGQVAAVADNIETRALALSGQPSTKPNSLALQKEVHELWATEPHYSQSQLASIGVRTAIVIGDHDDVIRPDHTKYLATTVPGARLIILHGVGHAAVLQDPVGYARAVLGFVDPSTQGGSVTVRQR